METIMSLQRNGLFSTGAITRRRFFTCFTQSCAGASPVCGIDQRIKGT